MNIKQLLEQHGITPFKAGSSHGGEWHSSCPGCGGGDGRTAAQGRSDRFQIWPERTDGGMVYCCRKCGAHGDTIQFLIDFDRKTFPEACALLGITKGRKQSSPYRTPSTPKPPAAAAAPVFTPATPDLPSTAWMAKATEFAEWCCQQLDTPEGRAMLDWRDLTLETARRYSMGFNPGENNKDLYRSRKAWGLPDEKNPNTGRLRTQWLPRGLVMPVYAADGQVVHLRIRRRPQDIKPGEKAYQHIKGGAHVTLVLEPQLKAHAVTESGLDAYLCAQEGRGVCGAVCTWNAQASPDAAACSVLDQDLRILVALDADPVTPNAKTGKPESPGAQGSVKWLQRWPNTARRHPVPVGKDPGEAIKAGCNLRAWIFAGLPPVLTIGDHADLACDPQKGGAAISGATEEKGGDVDGDPGVQQVVDQVDGGAGNESAIVPDIGEEKAAPLVAAPANPVAELRYLLLKTGITVVKKENGANLTITGGRPDASPELKKRVSCLVFQDPQVFEYLNQRPDGRFAVNS